MKNKFITAVAVAILIGSSGLLLASGSDENSEKKDLPGSLDKYYETQPPLYIIKMYELGTTLGGITANIQQDDMDSAKRFYEAFKQSYEYSSGMVPEWSPYYKLKPVEKMGIALEEGNIAEVFENLREVEETCYDCHKDTISSVWNKYLWRDFRTITIDTPEGPLPWAKGKMKYLDVGIAGTAANIMEGDQSGAQQSFYLLESMFDNMTRECVECHGSEPRRYYVDDNVRNWIDILGEKIDAGDLEEAGNIIPIIGSESCHKCHVVHMPAQYSKDGE